MNAGCRANRPRILSLPHALLTRARRAERAGKYDIASRLFARAADRWPNFDGASALRLASNICAKEAASNTGEKA